MMQTNLLWPTPTPDPDDDCGCLLEPDHRGPCIETEEELRQAQWLEEHGD